MLNSVEEYCQNPLETADQLLQSNVMDIFPNKKRFFELAHEFDLIPLAMRLPGDDETPLTVFRKIKADGLLETVENQGGPGRYSLVSRGETLSFTLRGNTISHRLHSGQTVCDEQVENPYLRMRELLGSLRVFIPREVPAVFLSMIGFLAHEAAAWFEKVPLHPRTDSIPDGRLVLPEIMVGCDAFDRALWLITYVFPGDDSQTAYAAGQQRLMQVAKELEQALEKRPVAQQASLPSLLVLTQTRQEFMDRVMAVKEHICAGDLLQGVIAQQFVVENPPDPMIVYRRLRAGNPSPYHFFLDQGDYCLVGASPEVMVKLSEGTLTICPIAGTKPRGKTPQQDIALEEALKSDEKERAEHLMLVDLARNDVGRVAIAGSVNVTEFMKVERYSHVMHLVSTVNAKLRKGKDAFDVIAAAFPAGTLTGAPKVRAMEILYEQEPQARGPYGGMVIRLGLNGDLDSCITIRTVVFASGRATVTAGAGIVHQSVPEVEYEESLNKAQAALRALGVESSL